MSAYSDWKCGALSDDEYRDQCNWEAREDDYLYNKMLDEADIDYEDEDFDDEEDL